MKAGDILVSSVKTWKSCGIRLSTRSRFSHVAMVLPNNKIFEATPNGVLPTSIKSFVDSNDRVLLLKRPKCLSNEQIDQLVNAANSRKGSNYNLLRTLSSGFSQFGFNFLTLVTIVFSFLFVVAGSWLYLSMFIAAMSIPLALLFLSSNPVKSNKWFKKLGVKDKYLTDLNSHFCSQLVLELDNDFNGGLNSKWKRPNEPRPKDIKKLSLKAGFTSKKIK